MKRKAKKIPKILKIALVAVFITIFILGGFLPNFRHLKFQQEIKTAQAAEVTIDATLKAATSQFNPSPAGVFINASTGYVFYIDADGNDVRYRKTTDGGATWNSETDLTTDSGWLNVAVWYDQWTPGDTGTKIHILANEIVTDDVMYNSLDTSNDSLNGWVDADTGFILNPGDGGPSIVKSTDGYFFAVWFDSTPRGRVMKSVDGVSWSSVTPSTLMTDYDDHAQLLPLSGGDVLLILWDESNTDLMSNVYDEGTDSWLGWTTVDGSIITDLTYNAVFGASVYKTTGDIYLAYNNDVDSATGDLKAKKFTGGAWSNLTDIATNLAEAIDVKMAIDESTGELYGIYTRGGTAGDLTDVYYKKSSNDGSTWNGEIQVNTTQDDIRIVRTNLNSSQRLYPFWYNEDLNYLLGNTISPLITVSATGTQVGAMTIDTADNYVGGAFTFQRSSGTATATQIVISETGSINATTNLSNLKVYYETTSTCSYDGTETLFGTDSAFDSAQKATTTGTMLVGTTTPVCVYIVLTVGSGASALETVEIEITNPLIDAQVSAGAVFPATAVAIPETTVIQSPYGNLMVFWDGNGAPAGWSCVSCLAGDPFYQVFPRGAAAYGVTSGSSTHTHTPVQDGNSSTFTGATTNRGDGSLSNAITHYHAPPLNSNSSSTAVSNLPTYRDLKIIKYDNSVTSTIPAGAIAFFATTSLPSGWSAYTSQNNYFLRGNGTAGGTGGSANGHNHTVNIIINNSSAGETNGNIGTTIADHPHTHNGSTSTDSQNQWPLSIEVVFAKASATTTVPDGMYAFWDNTAPPAWSVQSGSGQNFYQRFLFGNTSTNFPVTNGAAAHTHTTTTITTNGANELRALSTFQSGLPACAAAHTHTVSVGYSAENNLPPYRDVIIAIATKVIVDATGTQVVNMSIPSTDNYVGGAFTFISTSQNASVDVTSIAVTASGTVAFGNISNLKLFYKQQITCDSAIPSDASAFNAVGASFNTAKTATATGVMSVGSSTICVYSRIDIGSGASNNDTLDIQISNPSKDVLVSNAAVVPSTAVEIDGVTTLLVPYFTQNYFRFYADNDAILPTDPWPSGSVNVGELDEIDTLSEEPPGPGQIVRIRMSLQLSNIHTATTSYDFKLQFGQRLTTCGAIASWTDLGDPGGTAIWRGYNATPVDGTALSGNPATPGDLLLGVSDRAATYEEANNSALNPFPVAVGEDMEYDWVVQHNGASPGTDYCFRMVKSGGAVLTDYIYYPALKTAVYRPRSQNWRWYTDENNETPTSALAAQNVAPSNVTNTDILKLRMTIKDIIGVAGVDIKFKIQYSEYSDFSQAVYDAVEIGSCLPNSLWCYGDGVDADNDAITTLVLTDSTGNGTHNESGISASTYDPATSTPVEFEFTLKHAGARANAVYFFRAYDVTNGQVATASTSPGSYPSLQVQGAQLSFSINGLSSGVSTESIITDIATVATSVPFGTLSFGSSTEGAHRLTISTNATDGYQIFMFSNQGLLHSGYGAGTELEPVLGTNSSPLSWASGCDSSASSSCFGYHTSDAALAGGSTRFAPDDTYAKFASALEEVAFSLYPIDNESTDIIYRTWLNGNQQQPAGQYENNVTFIVVPAF